MTVYQKLGQTQKKVCAIQFWQESDFNGNPALLRSPAGKKKRKFWPKIKKKRIWRKFEAMHRQPRPCTEVTQWGKLLTRKTGQSSQSVKPHLWINFILMGCVWLSICLVTKVIFNERNGKTGHRAGHSIVLRLYELKWFRPLIYTTIRQSFPPISYGTGCFFSLGKPGKVRCI